MSYVIAAPEMMMATASDLASIGSDLSLARSAATQATVALTPAAADEISVGIAHLFSEHAEGFQTLAGKSATFHEQFVQNVKASASSYNSIEDALAALLKINLAETPFDNFSDLWQRTMDFVFARWWLTLLLLPFIIPAILIVVALSLVLLVALIVGAFIAAAKYNG